MVVQGDGHAARMTEGNELCGSVGSGMHHTVTTYVWNVSESVTGRTGVLRAIKQTQRLRARLGSRALQMRIPLVVTGVHEP